MAAWCQPPSPRQPPLPLRALRLCLLLLHPLLLLTPPRRPPRCLEASSTRLRTPSCSSIKPLTPPRALASSCRSSTSSPCSPTPSRQPRASPTSDRADRRSRPGGKKRDCTSPAIRASGEREPSRACGGWWEGKRVTLGREETPDTDSKQSL